MFFVAGAHMVLVHGFFKKNTHDAAGRSGVGLGPETQLGVIYMNGRNPHLGSALDDLLEQDGLADGHAIAVKRVLAWQVGQSMSDLRISKTEMARRMGTSRAAQHEATLNARYV